MDRARFRQRGFIGLSYTLRCKRSPTSPLPGTFSEILDFSAISRISRQVDRRHSDSAQFDCRKFITLSVRLCLQHPIRDVVSRAVRLRQPPIFSLVQFFPNSVAVGFFVCAVPFRIYRVLFISRVLFFAAVSNQ